MFGRRKRKPAADAGYEYKMVEVFWLVRGPGRKATKTIRRMQKDGWEYVDQITGPLNRVDLTFRRLR